jgi:hypothetical protein
MALSQRHSGILGIQTLSTLSAEIGEVSHLTGLMGLTAAFTQPPGHAMTSMK